MAGEQESQPLQWWTYVGVFGLWYLSTLVLDLGGVSDPSIYLWIAAVFISSFGVACFVNGRRCGALHCRISGPGYLLVAALAALAALNLVDVGRGVVFALFGGVFVVAYAIEFAVDGVPSFG